MRTGAGEKPFRILLAQEKEGKGFSKRANKKSPSRVFLLGIIKKQKTLNWEHLQVRLEREFG